MQENSALRDSEFLQGKVREQPMRQENISLDPDELPRWPQKRRLSARAWQMVWDIKMMNGLRAPETIDKFVSQFNDDRLTFGAKPRTTKRLCLSLTAVQMDDVQMTEETFAVIRAVEQQYGPVAQIEGRSADQWPLYNVSAKNISATKA